MARLILHLFGSPKMEVDHRPVEVDTRKATALLAYLAVTGETHQRDTLAALLWPEYDQTSARAALRRTLSTLNRALEEIAGSSFLDISRESVGLASGVDVWLDVSEFHHLVDSLDTHGHAASEICPVCLEALETAAALYREPFMAGFNLRDSPNFEEWQFFQEETLRRVLGGALEKLAYGLGARGKVEDAVEYARRWLALDTLSEEAHRQLMLLYLHTGQRNAALRQYRECVRILDQELGVSPLEETTRLYQAILNRESLPEAEGRLRFLEKTPANSPAVVPVTSDAALPLAPAFAGAESPPARPLVGRRDELAQMKQSFRSAQRDGCFITLEGEAGIGKTCLGDAFLAEARSRGARVTQARCYTGEAGLAYAPFIEAFNLALRQPESAARLKTLSASILAEAGRLLPEIAGLGQYQSEMAVPAESGQARFFEALRQVLQALLSGSLPGVLFLDELQWADSASLDLLTFLARRLKGSELLIVAAWRSETGETVQCLERLAAELTRAGQATRLLLRRLSKKDIVDLVRTYPGTPSSGDLIETFSQRLYEESEGLPFAAVEYLSMQAQRGDGNALTWEMPGSVRDLLRSRLENLDAAAQQLLSTAAVIGRSFDYTTLREISGRSELETVDGLDRLLAAGLVTEQKGQERSGLEIRYDFVHEKLRALIYTETSLARRRLLHRRIAETISRPANGRLESTRSEDPGLAAFHYQQAGLDVQAAEFHLLAGERARRLFANTEALAHFQAALAAGYPEAARLHEAIGDLRVLRGEYHLALSSYQTAAALCSPGCLANLEHKLGNVHQRLGEWDLAESHYQASLEALGNAEAASPEEVTFQVYLFADRGLVAHARGDLQSAQALATHALELAKSTNDPHALAQAYNLLGVLHRSSGDLEAAVASLEASLDTAKTLDDPLARIAALNNLALVYGEIQNLDRAINLAQQALELCQKRGDRHREAALHNNLADLLHRTGREEEAMAQLKQAVVIFAEIGAPTGSAQPEIWKLTEW
jgi:predicted ATPase/DNA-binding SARP family transcriptional activator